MPKGILRSMLATARDEVILMDGGMGSTIEDRGIDVKSAMWGSYCFIDPHGQEINDQIHREFVDAGAKILIANTHNVRRPKCEEFLDQINIGKLPKHIAQLTGSDRIDAFHEWIHQQAVESVRRAIANDSDIALASCLGSVEPLGPYATESRITSEEACRRFEPELRVRQKAGVDLIIFETLTTRSEIEGIAQLGHEHDLIDFAVGLTCGSDGNTLAGVSMAETVAILSGVKPLVYFVQCTRFDYVQCALEQLTEALGPRDIAGVYANDGRVWKDRHWHGQRTSPERYAEETKKWKQFGARIIGGCCGIGPSHIMRLRQSLT